MLTDLTSPRTRRPAPASRGAGAVRLGALALAAAAAASLTACASSDQFRVERRVVVSDAPGGTATLFGAEAVDLSACGDTWVNRDHLKDVDVAKVQATVLTVDGTAPGKASGSLALRPEGAPADGSRDVILGGFVDLVLRPGETVTLTAPASAGDALEAALKGSGRVGLVVQGGADRPGGFALKVALDVRSRYSPLGLL